MAQSASKKKVDRWPNLNLNALGINGHIVVIYHPFSIWQRVCLEWHVNFVILTRLDHYVLNVSEFKRGLLCNCVMRIDLMGSNFVGKISCQAYLAVLGP